MGLLLLIIFKFTAIQPHTATETLLHSPKSLSGVISQQNSTLEFSFLKTLMLSD